MKYVFWRLVILLLIALSYASPVMAEQAVVLIIYNSGSMKKNDPRSLTKQAVTQFIQDVSVGTQVALILFDKEAKTLAPLTPIDESGGVEKTQSGSGRAVHRVSDVWNH